MNFIIKSVDGSILLAPGSELLEVFRGIETEELSNLYYIMSIHEPTFDIPLEQRLPLLVGNNKRTIERYYKLIAKLEPVIYTIEERNLMSQIKVLHSVMRSVDTIHDTITQTLDTYNKNNIFSKEDLDLLDWDSSLEDMFSSSDEQKKILEEKRKRQDSLIKRQNAQHTRLKTITSMMDSLNKSTESMRKALAQLLELKSDLKIIEVKSVNRGGVLASAIEDHLVNRASGRKNILAIEQEKGDL